MVNIDPVISKGLMISDCECSVANGTATSTAQQGSGKRSREKKHELVEWKEAKKKLSSGELMTVAHMNAQWLSFLHIIKSVKMFSIQTVEASRPHH